MNNKEIGEIKISDVGTNRHHRPEKKTIIEAGQAKNRGIHFEPYGILCSQFDPNSKCYYHSHIVVLISDYEIEIPLNLIQEEVERFDKLKKHPEIVKIVEKALSEAGQ